MKKYISVVMMLFLICVVAYANVSSTNDQERYLYERGLRMIKRMDAYAENDRYISFFVNDKDLKATAKAIGSRDYTQPKAVYEIDNLKDIYTTFALKQSDIILGESSKKEIRALLHRRFSDTAGAYLNGKNNVSSLVIASIISVRDNFIFKGFRTEKTYIYIYGDAYAAVVTFTPYEDGIVSAYGNIVINESFLSIDSAQALATFFKDEIGLDDLNIKLVNK